MVTKWEYKYANWHGWEYERRYEQNKQQWSDKPEFWFMGIPDYAQSSLMNVLGADGWELVETCPNHMAIYKRVVPS